MSAGRGHPPRGTLGLYEAGALADEQAALIEEHLRDCAACWELLDRTRRADQETGALREAFHFSRSASADAQDSSADGSMGGKRPQAAPAPGEVGGDAGADASGWIIPDYERVQLCGEGAYGTVWAVRDRVGRYRALKIIDMYRIGSAGLSASAAREKGALETYCRKVGRHPYLIQVHHVGIVEDQLYYTMELADNDVTKAPVTGEFPTTYRPLTLGVVIRRRRIRPDTAVEITRRLLRGLANLHRLDLLHRDIKPANIVIVRHTPKLADIGMVSTGDQGQSVVGTPRYMPPDRLIDKTADTYALAKVLHEMIAGEHHPSFPELPQESFTESFKWDMTKISDLIVRACSESAVDRYASASDMLTDLEACADSPFRSLFNDIDESDPLFTASAPSSPTGTELIMAAIRAIPWILGFIALLIVLSWFC